jgi:hypothetical protein
MSTTTSKAVTSTSALAKIATNGHSATVAQLDNVGTAKSRAWRSSPQQKTPLERGFRGAG